MDSGRSDWTCYTVMLPPGSDYKALEAYLKALGFVENDWCAMNRHDGAHVSRGPMEPPADPPPWKLWELEPAPKLAEVAQRKRRFHRRELLDGVGVARIQGPRYKTMHLEKACLACKDEWGLHHRCPVAGGWNCC